MTDPDKEVTTDEELQAQEEPKGEIDLMEELKAGLAEGVELKPGIYEGLSYDEYALLPAINFSKLRRFNLTAAHARHFMDNPPEETKALRFGHLMHTVLLEPQKVDENFLVQPKVDGRTREGKRIVTEFKAKAKGRTIVNDQEMAICVNIRKNIAVHTTARELLYGQRGGNEISIVWKDEATGLLCKARLDRFGALNAQGVIVDVKSSGKAATLRHWQKSCYDFGYFEQAAMYREGAQTLFPMPEGQEREFIHLVVEKEPPNLIRLFQLDYDALRAGYDQFRDHLQAYANCLEAGEYPGWDEGLELAGLPAWAQKAFDAQL